MNGDDLKTRKAIIEFLEIFSIYCTDSAIDVMYKAGILEVMR